MVKLHVIVTLFTIAYHMVSVNALQCADPLMIIVDDVCVCSPLSTLVDQACQCVENAELVGNTCQCSAGFEYDISANECLACSANYYKDHVGNDACSPCRVNSGTDGQTGANAENLCQCMPGFFNLQSAVDTCQPCAVGTYKATFANQLACDACPEHATTIGEAHDEHADCVCTAGHTGASNCAPCAAGTYKSGVGSDACTACFTGATSPAGSTSVDACTCEAPFVTSNYACVCGVGHYLNSSSLCEPCAANSYKSEVGDQACTACPESTSHELLGATSAAACECDPGLELVDGTCTACPVNTYKATVGNTGCVPCPDNTHSQAGSSELWHCVPKSGFYGSGANLLACPANTLSSNADPATATVAGTDVNTCLCVAGYGGTSSTACTPCAVGSYKYTIATTECTPCPDNQSTLQEGSTSDTACECVAGYAGSSVPGCTACASSTYKETIGNVPCTDCGSNMDSAVASTDASQCTCVAGSVPSENGCEFCAENTYASGSTCAACPVNTVSSAGSASESACECIPGHTPSDPTKDLARACGDAQTSGCPTDASSFVNRHHAVSMLIDGTTGTPWTAGGDHTAQARGATWAKIDMQRVRSIESVRIHPNGRSHWAPPRANGIQVRVGDVDDPYSNPICGTQASFGPGTGTNRWSTLSCSAAGRFLFLTWPESCSDAYACGDVTLNEVQIFAPNGCITCDADTFKATVGDGACTPCAAGHVAQAGSTECLSATCQDGFLMDESYTCTPCVADTYFTTSLVGSSCQACPENSVTVGTAKIGTSSCKCALGYYGPNGGPCAACGNNEYTPEVGSATCTALPSGQGVVTEYVVAFTATLATTVEAFDKLAYRSAMKSVLGVTLEQVRVKDVRTLSSNAVRRLLNVGIEVDTEVVYESSTARDDADVSVLTTNSINSALSTESASFSATSFSAVELKTVSAFVCGAGLYPNGDECNPCSAGSYKPDAGNTSCTACAQHETTPPGATSAEACVCDIGYAYDTDQCVQCTAGTFKDSAEDAACTPCTAHSHSPSGSISAASCTCVDGYVSDSAACSPAPVGYWSANGELFACQANSTTVSIGSSSPFDCLCLPGFTLLNTECTQCSTGTYKNESGNFPCSVCPAHSQSAPGSKNILNCQCEQFYKKIQTIAHFECHMECPAGYEEKYEEVMYCPDDETTTQCFETHKQNVLTTYAERYNVTLPTTLKPYQDLYRGFYANFKCCKPGTPWKWSDANQMLARTYVRICDDYQGNCELQQSISCLPCNRQHYKTDAGSGQCQACFGHWLGLSPYDYYHRVQSLIGWADYSGRNLDSSIRMGNNWNLSYPGGYNTGGSEYADSNGAPASISRISAMSVWPGREYDISYVSGSLVSYGKTFATAQWDYYNNVDAYDIPNGVYPALTSVPYDAFGGGITGCFCRQGFYNTTVLPANGEGCIACPYGKFNSHWNSSTCHTCYTENPNTLECEVTNVSWNFGTFCAREEKWENFEYVTNGIPNAKKFYAWLPQTKEGDYYTFDYKMCKVEPGTQVYDWNVRNFPMRLPHTVWTQLKRDYPLHDDSKEAIFFSHPPPEGGVESCPANTWNNGSFMLCQPCANSVYDGLGATSASQCVCGPGFTQVDGACVGCAIGSFSSASSNEACTPCGSVLPHSTTLAGGATSPDQCVCEPGYTMQDGQCVACASGGTKNVAGNMACVSCPANAQLPVDLPHQLSSCRCNAGYAGDQFGCSACPLNHVKSDAGNTDCEPCGVGYHAPWTAGTSCVSAGCGKGKRKKAGTTTCSSCLQGKFKADWGDQECTTCSGARSRSKRGATSSKDCACPGKQIALAVEPAIIKELGAFIEDESTLQTTECTSSCTIQADSNRALKSISVDAGASDVHISVDGVLVFSCTSDCSRFTQELNMPNAQNEIQYLGTGTIAFKFYTEREIIFESEPAWMSGNRAAARKLVLKSKLRPGQGLYSKSQSKFNSDKCVPCVRGLICKDYAIETDA